MANNGVIVFFDLETTGLDTQMCDITQLSAVCGHRMFSVFMLPDCDISPGASNITGITVTEGILCRYGVPLATTPRVTALTSFISFLRSFHCRVLLAAHNAKCFDVPVLTRVLQQCSLLQQFREVVSEYLDTLPLSKALYPGMTSYKQKHLVSYFLGTDYDEHNATADARQRCDIVQLAAVSGGHSLNLYVIPRSRMQQGAAKVTGFRVRRQRLYLHRQLVLTNSLREVLVSFIAFLQMLRRPLLIGHNIRRFDCRLLHRALDELDLRAKFESSISGCVDTLPLAREMLKDRCLQSFRQENLVKELLNVTYKAHDALEDVRALQALYAVLQPTQELVWRHMFTLDTMNNKPAAKANLPSMTLGQNPVRGHFQQMREVTEDKAEDMNQELKT